MTMKTSAKIIDSELHIMSRDDSLGTCMVLCGEHYIDIYRFKHTKAVIPLPSGGYHIILVPDENQQAPTEEEIASYRHKEINKRITGINNKIGGLIDERTKLFNLRDGE